MMHFTSSEILISLLYAVVFGALFFILYSAVSILKYELGRLIDILPTVFQYDKILEKPTKKQGRNENQEGGAFAFMSVIIFALGFVLLSYYALDGCVRIYLLLFALSSFFIPKALLYEKIALIFEWVFEVLFYALIIAFRIAAWPFLRLFLYLKGKELKLRQIFFKNKS